MNSIEHIYNCDKFVDMKDSKEGLPIDRKLNLTIAEAAEYSNIGQARIRSMIDDPRCNFALHVGTKHLIKRKLSEEYLNSEDVRYL